MPAALGCDVLPFGPGVQGPGPPAATAFAPEPPPSPVASPESAPAPPGVRPRPRPAPAPARQDAALQAVVEAALGEAIDHYAVVVQRVGDQRSARVHDRTVHYAASLFKLPVMVEVYHQVAQGKLQLGEYLTVTEADLEFDLGTSVHEVGDRVAVGQLLEEMITYSDNSAAIMLLSRVGTQATDETLAGLGLTGTSVATEDIPTDAADLARLLVLLAEGKVVDEESSAAMLDLLRRQAINDRLPAGVPPGVPVAHKTGNWDNATHDVGVVFAPRGAYVIAVLSDLAWENEGIVRLSRAVYEYFDRTP